MFGHQPDSHDDDNSATDTTVDLPAAEPVSDGVLDDNLAALAVSDDDQQATPSDVPALIEDHETDGKDDTDAAVVEPTETPVSDTPTPTAPATPSPDTNALLDIKQQALQQLSPLVGHLDQSPEEKFRTTMMMIQASDNQDMVKTAYEAAQAIPDEKIKAQALLDVINEINYFTQRSE